MCGWSSCASVCGSMPAIARNFQRHQPLHRSLPGQKHRGKSPLPQRGQQIEIVDLLSDFERRHAFGRHERRSLLGTLQIEQPLQLVDAGGKPLAVLDQRDGVAPLLADVILFVDQVAGQRRRRRPARETRRRTLRPAWETRRSCQRYSRSTLTASTSVRRRSAGGRVGNELGQLRRLAHCPSQAATRSRRSARKVAATRPTVRYWPNCPAPATSSGELPEDCGRMLTGWPLGPRCACATVH